jgi:exosome complex exonuclease RRP6
VSDAGVDAHARLFIDVLALREHMHALNSSFMDPSIVKVLHGADHDVQWMARDFGLYVVNLFDTSQAARVLQLERASLAHVLAHYCGVTLDKRYQLADWRVRPLTPSWRCTRDSTRTRCSMCLT